MVTMNRYGDKARRYWEQSLPEQYARIGDPESWFAALGEYAALMIDEMADELAGDDLPAEGYLDKVVRLAAARKQAEQAIMTDLRPQPTSDPDGDDEDEDDELAAAITPLVIFRGYPSRPAGEWEGPYWR